MHTEIGRFWNLYSLKLIYFESGSARENSSHKLFYIYEIQSNLQLSNQVLNSAALSQNPNTDITECTHIQHPRGGKEANDQINALFLLVSIWTSIRKMPRLIAYVAKHVSIVVLGICPIVVAVSIVVSIVAAVVSVRSSVAVGVVVVAATSKRILGVGSITIAASSCCCIPAIRSAAVLICSNPIHLRQFDLKVLSKS